MITNGSRHSADHGLDVPVLIVGADGSGLTAALCLSDLDIDSLLIERHATTSLQPRAHLLNPRTMEVLGQHGLADDVYQEGAPIDHCGAMVWMTSLGGDEPTDRERSVTTNVRARYMIAADGGKTVGRALGVQMNGTPTLLDRITLHVSADFSEFLVHDDAVVNRITSLSDDGELEHCGVVPMGPKRWGRNSEEWTIMFCVPPGVRHADDDTVVAKVRSILKLPASVDMQVHSVSHWPVEGKVADRFRCDPVFLVGDAAHRHPPSGALGLNTGIQDAHNLTWKLAAVLQERAPEALLDSYEAERRPVAQDVVDRALFALVNQIAMTAGIGLMAGADVDWNRAQLEALLSDTADGRARQMLLDEYFRTNRIATAHLGMELGYDYADAGFVATADVESPRRDPLGVQYTQTSLPGHLLPHAWLQQDGERVATHHLVAPGRFLLLTGSSGGSWIDAAATLSEATGVPIDAYAVGRAHHLRDDDGVWSALRGHDERGALLVRPDGFVALRGSGVCESPAALIAGGLRAALGHTPPASVRTLA